MNGCVFATVSLLPGVLGLVVNELFAVDWQTKSTAAPATKAATPAQTGKTNGVRLQFPPRQKSQDDDQVDQGHTDSPVG